MATLEDILAATKILAESSDNRNGGEEKRNCDSDAKKDDDNSAADATKGIDERETVLDINNCLDNFENEKAVAGHLSRLSAGDTSELDIRVDVNVSVDGSSGALVGDEKNEDGKDSITDNGGNIGSDGNKLDATERKSSYADVDGCENGQANGEKLEDLDHGFHVGDFVWGKIKSHPWWPGQVYDPKDASDFAMKRRQDGRLLVAFFGDGSWSWCLPSQLKPFLENFEEMSVGSSSKSFVNAVQSAVDDISILLESKLSCRCVPLEKRGSLARTQVTNAGIKAGGVAPDVDIHQLSVAEYEPTGVLARLTQFATADFVDNVDNTFELAVLRSWLSAFFRGKGVHPLPVFCEPLDIEGLEDKNKTAAEDTNDFSVPIEVPLMGPLDDDWVSSPSRNGTRSQPGSGDKTYHRRKQKSVAEILGEIENLNEKSGSQWDTAMKEGKDIWGSKSSKKKKKSNVEEVEDGGTQGISSTRRLRRKRKVEVSELPEITATQVSSGENRGEGDAVSEGTLSGKRKRKTKATELPKIAAKNSSKTENKGGGDDVSEGTSGKPKRKAKVNESPIILGPNVSNMESRGNGNDASEGTFSGKRKRKTKAIESTNVSTEEASNKENRGGGNDASKDTLSGKPKRKAKVNESSVDNVSGKRKTKAKATESTKKEVSNTENRGAGDDASEGTLSGKKKRKEKVKAKAAELPKLEAKNISKTKSRGSGNDATEGTLTGKRKRKAKATKLPNIATEEVSNKENKSGEVDVNEGTLSGSTKRNAKVTKSSDKPTEKVSNEENNGSGGGASEGTLSGKPKRKAKVTESPNAATKKVSNTENRGGGVDASEVTLSGKPKRKAKVTESPNAAMKKVSNAENSNCGDDASERSLTGKPKKLQVVAPINSPGEGLEEPEMASPRERKKSKYLSPPYTNPTWRIGNSSFKMGTVSDKTPKGDTAEEHTIEASADPSASTSVSKSVDKSSNDKVTNSHQEALDASGKENPRTAEENKKIPVAASDVDIPVDELVLDIQSAARDASYLSKEGCLDAVSSFVSALRSSVYVHGPNYKVYKKWKNSSKRKSIASQKQGNQVNDPSHKKVKPDEKKMSEGKKKGKKPDSSKSKKAPEISDGNASSNAFLVLKFTAEYPLPSKDEIVRLFSKFGSLNETETRVATDSHSVQIVYTKDADTEAAFKSAVSERPFGDGNVVNYSFQQSSGSKSRSSHSKSTSRKRALEKHGSSQPKTDYLLSDVRVIRQKIDIMSAILENYHSKFSPEDKSGLGDEMKSLLENVETVSEKVRVLAEKSPA